MAEVLAAIPNVEIDPEGTFKYIYVRVNVKGGDTHKDIIRGTKSAEYHSKLQYSMLRVSLKHCQWTVYVEVCLLSLCLACIILTTVRV